MGYNDIMRVMLGKVVGGKVIVDAALEEGATVTVVDRGSEAAFELDDDSEADILAAMEEADRGEFVDGEGLLRELRSQE